MTENDFKKDLDILEQRIEELTRNSRPETFKHILGGVPIPENRTRKNRRK